MRHLPREWVDKRVAVLFQRQGIAVLKAILTGDNDGGIFVELREEQKVRKRFLPWSAVAYIELLEEVEKSRSGVRITSKPPGL